MSQKSSKNPPAKPGPAIAFGLGDPLPMPETVEHSADTGWDLWTKVEESHAKPFEPTAPASLSELKGLESWAKTAPAGLEHAAPAKRATDALDEAMKESRWHNRVCLRPERWRQLYEMLPNKIQERGNWRPPPPIIGAAWGATSAIPKRLCFQEHLMWAHQHGALDQVVAFFRSVPETEWLHMDET